MSSEIPRVPPSRGEIVMITEAGKAVAQLRPPPVPRKPDFAARFGLAASPPAHTENVDVVGFLSDERGE